MIGKVDDQSSLPPLSGFALKYLETLIEIFGHDFLAPPDKLTSAKPVSSINHPALFICFTNRSGSNYLAELLHSTGCVNLGGEFFNPNIMRAYCKRHKLESLSSYLAHRAVKEAGSALFAAKIGTPQLIVFDRLGVIDSVFSNCHYVVIERSDKLAQAVSYSIASQSKQWTSYMNSEEEIEILFKPDVITSFIDGLIQNRALLSRYFTIKGISPHFVLYEELVKRPFNVVGSLLEDLNITDVTVDLSTVRTHKQANSINDLFRDKMISLFNEKPGFSLDQPLRSLVKGAR